MKVSDDEPTDAIYIHSMAFQLLPAASILWLDTMELLESFIQTEELVVPVELRLLNDQNPIITYTPFAGSVIEAPFVKVSMPAVVIAFDEVA